MPAIPISAIRKPAIVGPITRAPFIVVDISATPLLTVFRGTRSDTSALRAGLLSANELPTIIPAIARCHISTRSSSTSTPTARSAIPINTCATMSRRGRRIRSARIPPSGDSSSIGTERKNPSTPSISAESVSSTTSQLWEIDSIQNPIMLVSVASHSRRKPE